MPITAGIHHISAMVNDAQRAIDFYTGVLGLRLVKKTINFDRPEVYHLYFGNVAGDPGTVITFFPWAKQPKGRVGTGQVGETAYMIPKQSISFWKLRLQTYNVEFKTSSRFGETYIKFDDPDGLHIELVERDGGLMNQWDSGEIPTNYAIIGFAGATLLSKYPHKTADVLESILGLTCLGQEGEFLRFKTNGHLGNIIDIKLSASVRGLMGAGTVHHIAWRASDEAAHLEWRNILQQNEYFPTEILDRNYFKAIYFHEGGGILFEIATDPPGFTIDEPLSELGSSLMLPTWLEDKREELEELLPHVEVKGLKGE